MKERSFWAGFALAVLLALASGQFPVTAQESLGRWTNEACYTNACVEETLNRLTPARAAETKVTTWDRGITGITYVWYRK